MKGLILSSFYTAKKSLYTYLVVAVFASIAFSFLNPIMACFLPMIFLISPVTDNIKHEKDSKWMYYVSTLPSGRKSYVNGYFTFYGVLILIGLILGTVSVSLVTQDFAMIVTAILVGIGGAGTYAMMFPLTFKFGPENSNVILITTSVIVIALFFIVFYGVIFTNLGSSVSSLDASSMGLTFIFVGIYAAVGLLFLIISYIASMRIFSKQEL
ncbi:ABC-2 transporter permease [Staphylococcus caeli]|uniref:ABC-2 transporter permease n=1 Tax=Staphylococcus caeli TaxID=2201815 RepID=UPI003F577B7A